MNPSVDLWVAAWSAKKAPAVAGFADWTFWQYSNRAAVQGVPSALDGDRFNGSLADLHAYSQAFTERRQGLLAQSPPTISLKDDGGPRPPVR